MKTPLCLQSSIDDKFQCVEELEGHMRRLQLALREKERDLERLRCILSNNEETITVQHSAGIFLESRSGKSKLWFQVTYLLVPY